ncbi:hypothetical protein A176_006862 [Myxococcus hansupus]|uniref:DUF2381 family protein n=1 Tax=Pseudomyxococcus hansupus TaxID=1297742 RepID=A0A0H4X8Q4_9BACT|nr:DUF2381 family protein [Myxococcus hansupus]AKQ69950.1 hypothetical protein A176_006862 [Myxococcus hansupus]
MPRLVAILSLLLGFAAPAQSLPAVRERIERRVVLSGDSSAQVPEVRIAAGAATLLRFDALLQRDAIEVEGRERFHLVEVGERILVLEPAMDLGPGERLMLRVRYADDAAPAQGVFALVSHASEVDARVNVFRKRDSVEVLRAELADVRAQLTAQEVELRALQARCQASGPAGLVMAGSLRAEGVRGGRIKWETTLKSDGSLDCVRGEALHSASWSVVSFFVRNKGPAPWKASTAKLRSLARGERVEVVAVRTQPQVIAPGETGRIIIEVAAIEERAGEKFSVELGDDAESGRRLSCTMTFDGRSP